jgi:regulator of sirC expression with transglutaminase-like and TPR domain
MVGFQPAGQPEQIIDGFDGGRVLTRTQAVELVSDNVERVDEHDFEPAPKRAIITRMLRNLIGNPERESQGIDALRYLNVIVALNPDSARDRYHRARLQMQLGQPALAKADLRWLLDHPPADLHVERLGELYRSL